MKKKSLKILLKLLIFFFILSLFCSLLFWNFSKITTSKTNLHSNIFCDNFDPEVKIISNNQILLFSNESNFGFVIVEFYKNGNYSLPIELPIVSSGTYVVNVNENISHVEYTPYYLYDQRKILCPMAEKIDFS